MGAWALEAAPKYAEYYVAMDRDRRMFSNESVLREMTVSDLAAFKLLTRVVVKHYPDSSYSRGYDQPIEWLVEFGDGMQALIECLDEAIVLARTVAI